MPTKAEIIEWYHIARTIVGDKRYDRMLQTKKWAMEKYPTASPKQVWFKIEEAIS